MSLKSAVAYASGLDSRQQALTQTQASLPAGYRAVWNGACDWLGIENNEGVEIGHLEPHDVQVTDVAAWARTIVEMHERRDRDMPNALKGISEGLSEGFKVGDVVRIRMPDRHRPALASFADEMEAKLKRNDHKTSWRELPVEALFRLLQIEIEEFKVAKEFLSVAEARNELVDIANFGMILWDRLGMEDQKAKVTP